MSYMPFTNYNQITLEKDEHFVLGRGEHYRECLLVWEGNVTAEPDAVFMDEVKMISPYGKVVMENGSLIYHLHIMNGCHIYLNGEHSLICELLDEFGDLFIHVGKNCKNWESCFEEKHMADSCVELRASHFEEDYAKAKASARTCYSRYVIKED